ncbi:MAG: hypothetical protein SF162_16665 [bacterium]|nr:hypothetical protein [bacterium]
MPSYSLNAKVRWADTGYDVLPAQNLFISATGGIGPWGGRNIGSDGTPVYKWNRTVVPNEYFCKLVGRIGTSGIPFGIGSGYGNPSPPEGRLYVSVNDGVSFSDNTGSFNLVITQDATAIDNLIIEIGRYNVTVYKDGLAATDPNYAQRRAWTFAELTQVLFGLQFTARALYERKYPGSTASTAYDQMQSLFRRVMNTFQIRRVQNGYIVAANDECNGTTNQGCTSNGQGAIVLYGDVNVTQYTIVHELGHYFNNRSATSGGTSLFARMESASESENTNGLVFGVLDSNFWRRGARGWGSGPASVYTDEGILTPPARLTNFQQNSYTANIAPVGDERRIRMVDEATADMFLNWVYAVATSRAQGFLNVSWLANVPASCTTAQANTAAGCPDPSNPGNVRYDWMQTQMGQIFAQQPTWVR